VIVFKLPKTFFVVFGTRGLIYKTSYDKYTTMLRHAEGLRQMYDKTRFTKKIVWQLQQKLRQNVRHLISCRTTASSMHAV